MTLKTSWTDSQLEQLYKPFNHKIEFDGYQYKWLHKLDGVWNIHSLKLFDDENSLVSNSHIVFKFSIDSSVILKDSGSEIIYLCVANFLLITQA